MVPTEKQLGRIQRLIDYRGREFVEEHFKKHFPTGDLSNMTKDQAQKFIIKMDRYEKHKPILGVVGRDVPFSNGRRYGE